jgi:hypothetical protein
LLSSFNNDYNDKYDYGSSDNNDYNDKYDYGSPYYDHHYYD